MKQGIAIVLAVLALIAAPVHTPAQPAAPGLSDIGLSPEDLALLSDAARKLYDRPEPLLGEEKSWTNWDTNSSGTVQLREMQDNCVTLRHLVNPRGAARSLDIRIRRCRNAEGEWVLSP